MVTRRFGFSLMFALLFAVCASGAFASVSKYSDDRMRDIVVENFSERPFEFYDSRLQRLGNTGTCLANGVSALFYNPANLASDKGLKINFPSLDVNLYGLTNIVGNKYWKGILDDVLNGHSSEAFDDVGRAMNAVSWLYEQYGYGVSPLLKLQADFGFTLKGFAFDAFFAGDLSICNFTGSSADTNIMSLFSAGVSLGYGLGFDVGGDTVIRCGLSFAPVIRMVSDGISINDFLNTVSSKSSVLDMIFRRDAAAGVQFPINIGVTAVYSSNFYASIVFKCNAFNTKMRSYGDLGETLTHPFKAFGGGSSSGYASIKNKSSVDIGFAYNAKRRHMNPRLEVDFVNIFDYSKNEVKDNSLFLSHLRIGLEVFVAEFLRIGGGIDQGRISFGFGFDLWPFVMDFTFFWLDTTPELGEHMLDCVSLNVKIGWDRTR